MGKPVDRDRWYMTPQTVNAYYNPTTNEICFPAGILQPPYFNPDADPAENYGAIGVVIGHEMTHGFDDQGSQFDKDGNFANWWTPADKEKFTGLTDRLAAQFDRIIVLGDTHANGRLTLGENIADQGGLRVAYTAYHMSLEADPESDKTIDGFTPDQRFYPCLCQCVGRKYTRRGDSQPHKDRPPFSRSLARQRYSAQSRAILRRILR